MSNSRDTASRPIGVHYGGSLRSDLIAGAAERVAAVGPEHLSLRDVARRVGVSHAAPAHHFGDKAGLLTAVAAEGFALFVDHMAAAVAASPDDPEHLLVAMTRAYADFAADRAGYFEVMFRPSLIDVDDERYAANSQAAFDALRAVIAHCQELGWHPDDDVDAIALASWSFAHGIAVLQASGALQRHAPTIGLEAITRTLAVVV